MNDQQEPVPASPDTPAVPVLDTDELNNLAKFLDALLEVDMEVKRNERVSTNGNYPQAIYDICPQTNRTTHQRMAMGNQKRTSRWGT